MSEEHRVIPGEIKLAADDIEINEGRAVTTMRVVNKGDRPVQVGSHIHFAETNAALGFDRVRAFGLRLDIPSGTTVRFEPGQETEVELVPLAGARHMSGVNNLVDGPLDGFDAWERVRAFEEKE